MKDCPSDMNNNFPEDKTQRDLTERIMAALEKKKKEARKEQEPAEKAKKTVGTQSDEALAKADAPEKEKAKPKKTAKPKTSADQNKTQKDLTDRIAAALEERRKEARKEPEPAEKAKKTVGTQSDEALAKADASKKEKAKPKKTAKPKPSTDPDKTQKDLTERIRAELARKKQEIAKPEVKTEKPKIDDPKKVRALIKAVKKGKFKKVKRLVEEGADVNKPDNYGWTPLGLAVNDGEIKIVKFLLENGARPASRDLKIVYQMGDESIIRLLEAKMGSTEMMNKMESVLDKKPQKQEQPATKRATPLEPESFARLHGGRSPIREVASDAPPPKETADQLIELGFNSLEQGHIQSAEAYFKKALELEPDNIAALTNLGFILCKHGKYELAEIPLTEALRLCSDIQESAKIHMNLAIALFMQKKIQSSENQINAVLKINPNDADAQKLLELIIDKQRKSDDGRFQADTRKQIKPAPKAEIPEEPSSAEERFQASTRKQIKPAPKPETSSGTQPAEKSIPASSGDQFFGLPKPDETPKKPIIEEIISADKAIALANDSAQKDDYESARKYLEKAIEIDPYSELAHRILGYAYEMLASREEEKENKNIHLRKAKEHTEKADKLKAAAEKQADKGYKAPDTGQIDTLFSPFESGPAEPAPQPQPSPPQPQPAKQKSDVKPGLRGQERGDTKEELDSSKERLKYLCKVILNEPPSYTGWQKAVEGYLALISHKTNLYIKSVNHRAVAIKLREAYENGHLADYIPAIIAHTQDVSINKGDFRARAETGKTYLEANQPEEAIKLFEETLLLNPNPTGDYDWVKDCLKELKAKMLISPAPEAEQGEEFESPPTVKQTTPQQDSSQLQPGEERVRIEGLPEGQVPKPVPAVPPASTSFPPPRPPFTDDEWAIGQLKESDRILEDHEQEQGRPPVPPTLPSMEKIPQMAEAERKLKLTKVQQKFTAGSKIFASIVVNFTEISPEQINELDKLVKKYTKLLLENPKTHFPHDATRDHLISLQERKWVSNETMMGFMEALRKYEGPKKAK